MVLNEQAARVERVKELTRVLGDKRPEPKGPAERTKQNEREKAAIFELLTIALVTLVEMGGALERVASASEPVKYKIKIKGPSAAASAESDF